MNDDWHRKVFGMLLALMLGLWAVALAVLFAMIGIRPDN